MKKQETISIIVPVYNVDKYIDRCIKSLQNQTYKNIEIILVDDGSTDLSSEMCDLYALDDQRVKVFHQNNNGITSARKKGLTNATGNYIGFVDPDDWIESNMYECLYSKLKEANSDLVCSGMKREKEGQVYAIWDGSDYKEGIYTGDTLNSLKSTLFDEEKIHISGSMCNKLFKRKLLLECIKNVDDQMRGVGDDTACVVPYVLKSDSIVIMNSSFYHGCDRSDSATHTKHLLWYLQANLTYRVIKESIQNLKLEYGTELINRFDKVWQRKIQEGLNNYFADQYDFRFDYDNLLCSNEKNIVIYGAGCVGKNYYYQLNNNKRFNVICWIDKDWKNKQIKDGLPVSGFDDLKKIEFDRIIIAINDAAQANKIKDFLIKKYCINENKVIWEKPKTFYEYGKEKGFF